jgi:tetratricopeptide (TPR) repeat protein
VLWASGVFAGVLIIGAGYWALERDEPGDPPLPAPAARPAAGGGTPPDLTSMTPREAADRLYDRIMRAASAGDSAEALAFLPMALDAYNLVVPLDADGHYHMSLLHALGGDYPMAREVAERALADAPRHLLLLGAAARAASELGDDDGADAYSARFLEAWDSERARGLEEYSMHAIPLAEMRQSAETRTGG